MIMEREPSLEPIQDIFGRFQDVLSVEEDLRVEKIHVMQDFAKALESHIGDTFIITGTASSAAFKQFTSDGQETWTHVPTSPIVKPEGFIELRLTPRELVLVNVGLDKIGGATSIRCYSPDQEDKHLILSMTDIQSIFLKPAVSARE